MTQRYNLKNPEASKLSSRTDTRSTTKANTTGRLTYDQQQQYKTSIAHIPQKCPDRLLNLLNLQLKKLVQKSGLLSTTSLVCGYQPFISNFVSNQLQPIELLNHNWRSVEEFHLSIRQLVHNANVYPRAKNYSAQQKRQDFKNSIKFIEKTLPAIESCPACLDDDNERERCKYHSIVLVKEEGWPLWPAILLNRVNHSKVNIKYVAWDEGDCINTVEISNIYQYNKDHIKKLEPAERRDVEICIDHLLRRGYRTCGFYIPNTPVKYEAKFSKSWCDASKTEPIIPEPNRKSPKSNLKIEEKTKPDNNINSNVTVIDSSASSKSSDVICLGSPVQDATSTAQENNSNTMFAASSTTHNPIKVPNSSTVLISPFYDKNSNTQFLKTATIKIIPTQQQQHQTPIIATSSISNNPKVQIIRTVKTNTTIFQPQNEDGNEEDEEDLGHCQVCNSSEAINQCGNCFSRNYCSETCQRHDWENGHREVCLLSTKHLCHTCNELFESTEDLP